MMIVFPYRFSMCKLHFDSFEKALKNSWNSSVSISPIFLNQVLHSTQAQGLPLKSITHLDKHSSIGTYEKPYLLIPFLSSSALFIAKAIA